MTVLMHQQTKYWNRWYTTKSYLGSAIWLVPLMALIIELITIRIVFALGKWLQWVPRVEITARGAIQVTGTVETLTISFTVFTFGSLLVAIQVASGQLTPRIIATALLRDNVIRFTVGLFTFTMMFAVGTGARIGETTPHFAVTLAVALGIASITAFLFLIDYTARLLRPVSIVWRVAEQGLKVIETVYPEVVELPHIPSRPGQSLGPIARIVAHHGSSASVLAINLRALVAIAHQADGVIEIVPRVGDFVAVGEPLFRLYGDAGSASDDLLRGQVAFGPERTIEQDSTFAFRVVGQR